MVNLKRILKEYKCRLDLKKIGYHGENKDERYEHVSPLPSTSSAIIWPSDFLPYTKYLKDRTESNLDRIERWKNEPLKLKKQKACTNTDPN